VLNWLRIPRHLISQDGPAVAICGCSDKIREVFEIIMLENILQVCQSENEARERLMSTDRLDPPPLAEDQNPLGRISYRIV
jgi:hypothetical protein